MTTSFYGRLSLAALLRVDIGMYEEDFEKYWELNNGTPPDRPIPDELDCGRQFDRVGRAVFSSARTFTISPELGDALRAIAPEAAPEETLQDVHDIAILRGRVEIDLGREACALVELGNDRISSLVLMLSKLHAPPRAAAYLCRASRLYLYGLDPECVVMCGAALEAALLSAIDDSKMAALGFRELGTGVDPARRIEVARVTGILPLRLATGAHRLRRQAKDLLEMSPDMAANPYVALSIAREIIEMLFPSEEALG